MDPVKERGYDDVKTMLLHELKLSLAMLLDKFNKTIKSEDDT